MQDTFGHTRRKIVRNHSRGRKPADDDAGSAELIVQAAIGQTTIGPGRARATRSRCKPVRSALAPRPSDRLSFKNCWSSTFLPTFLRTRHSVGPP